MTDALVPDNHNLITPVSLHSSNTLPPSLNGLEHPQINGNSHSSPVPLPPNTPDVYTPVDEPQPHINLDDVQQESDVRHEQVHDEDQEDSSSQHSPPPPTQFDEDSKMVAEEEHKMNGLSSGDITMGDHSWTYQQEEVERHQNSETNAFDIQEPAAVPAFNVTEPTLNGDREEEPPAKRARKHSDADQASAHCPTPPPASQASSMAVDATPTPTHTPTATHAHPESGALGSQGLNTHQYRFLLGIVRSIKKMRDAGPFLKPVDIVALGIPHYLTVIKTPMDFGTVERKLLSSNPGKPDTNPTNPRYYTPDEFIVDVRLIFSNCLTFNGPDHVVSGMAKRVEEQFDRQLKAFPGPDTKPPKPPAKKTSPVPPPSVPVVSAPPPKKTQPRRASNSMPAIRKNDPDVVPRPKREAHPSPAKDLAFVEQPKKLRKVRTLPQNDAMIEQFKHCGKILQELHKKQHYSIAYHFYEPVDWQRLGLFDYPKYVKKPMDLSTIRRKLDNGDYTTPARFHDDFKLMIRNCFNYNPAGTAVNQAGIELQRLFDEKWATLPPLHREEEEDEEDDEMDEDSEEEEKARKIAEIESQIETMKSNLANLKQKVPKQKKPKEKREKPPTPSTSKVAPKPAPPKALPKKKASTKKPAIADDDVLTFEQKKDLSEAITRLEGPKLERVIQIIHEGVPDLKNSNDEIELEVDLLPAAVLTKLFNFVIRPLKAAQQPKRNRGVKGTGTGGLKRKSMDEDVEAEKIRQLEERMALFDATPDGPVSTPAPLSRGNAMNSDSDSSSDDSSGSDSE